MKQRFIFYLFLLVLFLCAVLVLILRSDEDTWTYNSHGVWVRHGNPRLVPTEVQEQLFLLNEARLALKVFRERGVDLSNGPCLGTIFHGWAADIVHDPKSENDLRSENKCPSTENGVMLRVVEIDKNGALVGIQ